jgi:hypothetical protein
MVGAISRTLIGISGPVPEGFRCNHYEDSHGRRASRSLSAGPATSHITPCPTSTRMT